MKDILLHLLFLFSFIVLSNAAACGSYLRDNNKFSFMKLRGECDSMRKFYSTVPKALSAVPFTETIVIVSPTYTTTTELSTSKTISTSKTNDDKTFSHFVRSTSSTQDDVFFTEPTPVEEDLKFSSELAESEASSTEKLSPVETMILDVESMEGSSYSYEDNYDWNPRKFRKRAIGPISELNILEHEYEPGKKVCLAYNVGKKECYDFNGYSPIVPAKEFAPSPVTIDSRIASLMCRRINTMLEKGSTKIEAMNFGAVCFFEAKELRDKEFNEARVFSSHTAESFDHGNVHLVYADWRGDLSS